MAKRLPVGKDDFKAIITEGYLWADKSLLIKDIIDSRDEVSIFLRPRRSGKSLNLSMLRYYFDIREKGSNLFKGLKIAQLEEDYLHEQAKYPVILISFNSMF